MDPLWEKHPGWTPYHYVLDNPLSLVDPDGRQVRAIGPNVFNPYLGRGGLRRLGNELRDAYNTVRHPIETGRGIFEGIGALVSDPRGVAEGVIANARSAVGEFREAQPARQQEMLGATAAVVGVAIVTGGLGRARQIERLEYAASSAQGVRLARQLVSQEIAGGHAFGKHIGKFSDLGLTTRAQFAAHIEGVLNNPTATRQLLRGRRAFFDERTGTVVIRDPRHSDGGTAFIPTNQSPRAYFNSLE